MESLHGNCGGVVGRGDTLGETVAQARNGAAVLERAMAAAYSQSRFAVPPAMVAEWLRNALEEMPRALLAVGHPDPRESTREGMTDLTPLLTMGAGSSKSTPSACDAYYQILPKAATGKRS